MPAALQLLPVERRTRRSGKISPLLVRCAHAPRRAGATRRAGAILWCRGAGRRDRARRRAAASTSTPTSSTTSRRRSRCARDNEMINHEIVGSNPFYLVIESNEPGALKRWEVLKQIKDLQSFLLTLPGITSSISLVDYLELLESGLNKAAARATSSVDEQGNPSPAAKPKTFWEEPRNLEPVLSIVTTSPATFKAVVTPDFANGEHPGADQPLGVARDRGDARRRSAPTSASISRPSCRCTSTGNLVLLDGHDLRHRRRADPEPVARARRDLRRHVADVPVGEGRLPRDPAERAADPHLLRRDGLARHLPEPRHQPDRRDRARHRRRLDDPLHGAAEPRAAGARPTRRRRSCGRCAPSACRSSTRRSRCSSASSPSRSRASSRSRTSAC